MKIIFNKDLLKLIKTLTVNFDENSHFSFLQCFYLIYYCFFNQNPFFITPSYIQEELKLSIFLILKKYNIKYKNISTNLNIESIEDCFQFLYYLYKFIDLNNYSINLQQDIKQILENILIKYNFISQKQLLNFSNVYNFAPNFEDENIFHFFKKYDIDLIQDDILFIKNIKIPNFIKIFSNQKLLIDYQHEFYHLLFKIFAPYLYYDFSFYEAGQYKISEKDIVFDCGANMGLFAAYAASKGAKVYCFEPMSYIRKFLIHIKKLYPENIIIIPKAVGSKNDHHMFLQGLNPGDSHYENINFINQPIFKEQVTITTIDSFCEVFNIKPTFIKMDIEGSELEALVGSINTLKNNNLILSISLDHNIDDQQNIFSFMNSINLTYKYKKFFKNKLNNPFLFCQIGEDINAKYSNY